MICFQFDTNLAPVPWTISSLLKLLFKELAPCSYEKGAVHACSIKKL